MSGFNQTDGFFQGDYGQQQQGAYGQPQPANFSVPQQGDYDPQQQGDYDPQRQGDYDPQQQGYSQQAAEHSQGAYDMGPGGFPQDTQFQQFDYSQQSSAYDDQQQTYYDPATAQSAYTGTIMTPDTKAASFQEAEGFEDEPPLMEELGINFNHITQKTLAVLNPLKQTDAGIVSDADLAGPFVFCFAFGGSLLLAGKVQFGYIYGIGVVGCLAMYALLTLMSQVNVSPVCIVSTLGYCLLPMVILSFTAVAVSLQGILGTVLTTLTVLWCSISASKLFVTALSMDHQQLLVAYPCALVYAVFALLTVF